MLTDKQQSALDIITEYIARYGKSPTIDELTELMKQKSRRWVVQYLESLEKKGFITRWRGYRSIVLWNNIGSQTMINIPILGYANAWTPLVEAKESDYGVLPISKGLVTGEPKNYFVLRVEGTSMNDCKINGKFIENGSYILVDKTWTTPNDKDTFLFIVNGAATIKVKKVEWDNLYLLPKSKEDYHKPIVLSKNDDVMVNWKVVDVFNLGK